jgi:hypothetical protein
MDLYVNEDPDTDDGYNADDRYPDRRTEPWASPLDPLCISLARMDPAGSAMGHQRY